MKSDDYYEIDYSLEVLEKLKIKLNSGDFSPSWWKRHFRGLLNALIRAKLEAAESK